MVSGKAIDIVMNILSSSKIVAQSKIYVSGFLAGKRGFKVTLFNFDLCFTVISKL